MSLTSGFYGLLRSESPDIPGPAGDSISALVFLSRVLSRLVDFEYLPV